MRDCSLPKKAMITSSQITEPSMEVAIEMSSGKMRWTATELMEMSSVELIEEEDGFLSLHSSQSHVPMYVSKD
ncbi:hypothetical protein QYF36_016507 [Acer negundo]|nr:hypothetical protein QYF36_016507 [Acer negundo]